MWYTHFVVKSFSFRFLEFGGRLSSRAKIKMIKYAPKKTCRNILRTLRKIYTIGWYIEVADEWAQKSTALVLITLAQGPCVSVISSESVRSGCSRRITLFRLESDPNIQILYTTDRSTSKLSVNSPNLFLSRKSASNILPVPVKMSTRLGLPMESRTWNVNILPQITDERIFKCLLFVFARFCDGICACEYWTRRKKIVCSAQEQTESKQ